MKVIRHTDANFAASLAAWDRHPEPDPEVTRTVADIIRDVRAEGDRAVRRYTVQFGGPRLDTLHVPVGNARAAWESLPAVQRHALRAAETNIRAFARRGLRRDWSMRNRQGAWVGERFDPLTRVGIYVPGGTAPLVSTALMTCAIARTAGVPERVVATPAGPDGAIHPALLGALHLAGATEILPVGGAQAIAAMAYGTESIRPVLKVFGPGNRFVVEAKRQVFGRVAVDLLPGPSEILVLADSTAHPAWVAADLLAQAEHGRHSAVMLVTTSPRLLDAVTRQIERQLAGLTRTEHLRPVLEKDTVLVLARSLTQAVTIANRFAPEHLSLAVRDPDKVAARITSAGAIFSGGHSTVAAGDFMAGPSHELPTGGAGKAFPGLTADMFQRRTSIVRMDQSAIQASVPIINTFASMEGLDAHGQSASLRASPNDPA